LRGNGEDARSIGPTDETSSTWSASDGSSRQPLSTGRSLAAPAGKSGLVLSDVGLPRSVASLPSAAIRVTPRSWAKSTARCVATMIACCCACSSGESEGLSAQ
jgi:hypothetical protein